MIRISKSPASCTCSGSERVRVASGDCSVNGVSAPATKRRRFEDDIGAAQFSEITLVGTTTVAGGGRRIHRLRSELGSSVETTGRTLPRRKPGPDEMRKDPKRQKGSISIDLTNGRHQNIRLLASSSECPGALKVKEGGERTHTQSTGGQSRNQYILDADICFGIKTARN